ncbi:hypothetical protein BKA57DRAFT_503242 [Linnemannia elongata]|nr:hypothetical protein BKA57DRAFT_503242 [Linnemannia elongata]
MAKAQRISVSRLHIASRSKRQPTAYNLYIKDELPKYKATHPNIEHKTSRLPLEYAPENPNRTPS